MAVDAVTLATGNLIEADTNIFVNKVYNHVTSLLDQSISSAVTTINNWSSELQAKTVISITNVGTFLGDRIKEVSDVVNSIKSKVANIETIVGSLADNIISEITAKMDMAIDSLTRRIQDSIQLFEDSFNRLQYDLRTISDNLSSSIEASRDYLGKLVIDTGESVQNTLNEVKKDVSSGFTTVIAQANMNIITTVDTINKTSKSILEQGENLFNQTIDFVGNGITGLAKGFADLFENFQVFVQSELKQFSVNLQNLFMIDEDAMYARMAKIADKYLQMQKANIRKE